MTTSVKLPQWGMSMSEGTITQWFVAEGDAVSEGQELVEVEAAKVTDTVTAPSDGVMGPLLVAEGETVEVNTVLAEILGEGDAPASDAPEADAAGQGSAGAAEVAAPQQPAPARSAEGEPPRDAHAARAASGRVTGVVPLARKLAKERGVDLRSVTGTGTNGRIVVADVEAALAAEAGSADAVAGEAQQAASAGGSASAAAAPTSQSASSSTGKPLSRMRQIIGERMTASLRDSAQLTLTTTADVTDSAQMRSTVGGGARRPGYVDAVIRACALALREHPGVNAHLEGDRLVLDDAINIGMAVAVDDGLVVPVIRDADQLGLAEVGERVRDQADRARSGGLTPDDYDGGTFSVTSLGGQGIDAFTPILNPPQSAILGVGRVREVPIRFGNGLAWRQELTLSLTIDHRVVDGYPGALFLQGVVNQLERPRGLF